MFEVAVLVTQLINYQSQVERWRTWQNFSRNEQIRNEQITLSMQMWRKWELALGQCCASGMVSVICEKG